MNNKYNTLFDTLNDVEHFPVDQEIEVEINGELCAVRRGSGGSFYVRSLDQTHGAASLTIQRVCRASSTIWLK